MSSRPQTHSTPPHRTEATGKCAAADKVMEPRLVVEERNGSSSSSGKGKQGAPQHGRGNETEREGQEVTRTYSVMEGEEILV